MRRDAGGRNADRPGARAAPAAQRRFGRAVLLPATIAALATLLAGCGFGAAPNDASGPFGGATTVVTTIAVGPLTPSRVYLGTRAGLFVSSDAGQHWQASPVATFGGAGVRGIAASAIDRDTLWVATGAPLPAVTASPTASPTHAPTATPQPTFPATPPPSAPGAVWVSHDAGATWHWASARLPEPVVAVWAGTASANAAWAAILGGGLWFTNDDGLDWTVAGALPAHTIPQSVLGVDATGASVLLGTDHGLLRSSDAGKHWALSGDVRGSVHALVAAPLAPRTVYCLTDLGLYRSTDAGARFAGQSYGLLDTALAVGTNPDVLYTLAGLNVHRSTDAGRTWTLLQSTTTTVAGIVVSVPAASALATRTATATAPPSRTAPTATPPAPPADTILVALSQPAGVMVSRDGGQTWSQQGG